MGVIEYITEEVRRQGHNIAAIDGRDRVAWMLQAWVYAEAQSQLGFRPCLSDVVALGKLIEPQKNLSGLRTAGVRVGLRICPKHTEVRWLLERLFDLREEMTPLEFYKEFEGIHPFIDGNGRTGKVLLNWLNGTLLDPIFPPNDLFGEPILNP